MHQAPTSGAAACTSTDDARDRELVRRFRHGERQAFGELVARYQQPVFNAAYWVTRRDEDAADVAQTAFLKAAERIDDYDPGYRFFSWLYRIAVNEALNLVRGRGRTEPLDDEFDAADGDQPGPDRALDLHERQRALHAAMLKLSTPDRTVLTLRHFSECSYEVIAQVLEVDEKTVKSRLHEARGRLRRLLDGLEGRPT